MTSDRVDHMMKNESPEAPHYVYKVWSWSANQVSSYSRSKVLTFLVIFMKIPEISGTFKNKKKSALAKIIAMGPSWTPKNKK